MKRSHRWFSFVVLAAVALGLAGLSYITPAQAASGSLTTLFAMNNANEGIMFDVVAAEALTITHFDVNLEDPGDYTIRVYYKAGTRAGFENNAAAWTLLGEAAVTTAGLNNPTPVPIGGLAIPAGATYGIYIVNVNANGSDVGYTNGTTAYANDQLQILAGCGVDGLFGPINADRIFNGTIYYDYGAVAAGVPGPDMVYIPETAVVGLILADTPAYWAPSADAATDILLEGGKTFWVYGVDASGAFYNVMMSGRFFWVPVGLMGPNPDAVWNNTPLPTTVVE